MTAAEAKELSLKGLKKIDEDALKELPRIYSRIEAIAREGGTSFEYQGNLNDSVRAVLMVKGYHVTSSLYRAEPEKDPFGKGTIAYIKNVTTIRWS